MAYTCMACGSYVPDGTTHTCTGFRYYNPPATGYAPTYSGPYFDNAALLRLAVATERIAVALEKSQQIVTATTLKPLKLKASRTRSKARS